MKYLWCEHVSKTCCSSFQSDATEEEDGEDNIGEHSGEINNLARGGDTLGKMLKMLVKKKRLKTFIRMR